MVPFPRCPLLILDLQATLIRAELKGQCLPLALRRGQGHVRLASPGCSDIADHAGDRYGLLTLYKA